MTLRVTLRGNKCRPSELLHRYTGFSAPQTNSPIKLLTTIIMVLLGAVPKGERRGDKDRCDS